MNWYRALSLTGFAVCLMAAYGCDRKTTNSAPKSVPDRAAENSTPKAVGKWQALMGEEAPGKFYSLMTMDLRENGTVDWVIVMPDISKPGEKIQNRADGHWEPAANGVVVHLEKSPDGRPIPPNKRNLSLTWHTEAGVEWLVDAKGPRFKRIEDQ